MSNKTVCKEFTVTLISGKIVTAIVEVELSYESNYGADADGNRGIGASFVENICLTMPIDDVSWELDDNGIRLNQIEKEEAERAILEMADEYDWSDFAMNSDECYFNNCDF